jgi:hypothetical protein
MSHHVDAVVCRWCGHGRSIVELTDGEAGEAGAAGDAGTHGTGADGTGTDRERKESGAQSRIS